MIKKSFIAFGMLLPLFFIGCAQGGPSDAQVESSLKTYFKNGGLNEGQFSAFQSTTYQVDRIKIKEREKSMKDTNDGKMPWFYVSDYQNCWPIKVQLSGIETKSWSKTAFGKRQHSILHFDKEGDFLFCKDRFSHWSIEEGHFSEN